MILILRYRSLGIVSLAAYNAYSKDSDNDTSLLSTAIQSWELARQYTISQDDVDAGSSRTKNSSISKSCHGGGLERSLPSFTHQS